MADAERDALIDHADRLARLERHLDDGRVARSQLVERSRIDTIDAGAPLVRG